MPSILDLLAPPPSDGRRIYGVVTGVVTNNSDEKKLGRVRVRFRWFADEYESGWARVAVPLAGKENGTWLIPAVGDEVLVAFDQGDMGLPYVVGSLWSQSAAPPRSGAEAGSEVAVLHSRSGHVVRLDDREGEERIEIVDRSGENSIVIDTKDNAITLTCQGDLTLESTGGKVVLRAAKGVDVTSDGPMQLKADGNVDLSAGGAVKVKGATIDLN